jgi:hypothetical protein
VLIPRRDHRRQLAMVPVMLALYLGCVLLWLVLAQVALSAGTIFYQAGLAAAPTEGGSQPATAGGARRRRHFLPSGTLLRWRKNLRT